MLLGLGLESVFMKRASIICVGNELLNGQTVNSNAAYLGRKLVENSFEVLGCYTIGDDIDSIVKTLRLAADGADVVLVTGGLGPTDDDLTRQGFAKFLGVELELREEILKKINDFFTGRGLEMSANNKIQAYMPAGTKALANNLGTAPGIMAEFEGKLLVAAPGVPSEMKQMFEESVQPVLEKKADGQTVVVRKLKCFGTGESNIAQMLGCLMQRGRNPLINCTVDCGVVTLHIVATAEDKVQARQMAEKDEKMLAEMLGELVYGIGEQSLADVAAEQLRRQKKTIAVAESCTGGGLAKMLTDVPGASEYFKYGWVTYSNEAKIGELDVPADLIKEYGAVSEQVSQAMAKGAREKAKADFGVGITGIAGPTGGTEQKPVGLVYISVDSPDGCETGRFIFSHNRRFIRLRTAQTALNMLRLGLRT